MSSPRAVKDSARLATIQRSERSTAALIPDVKQILFLRATNGSETLERADLEEARDPGEVGLGPPPSTMVNSRSNFARAGPTPQFWIGLRTRDANLRSEL